MSCIPTSLGCIPEKWEAYTVLLTFYCFWQFYGSLRKKNNNNHAPHPQNPDHHSPVPCGGEITHKKPSCSLGFLLGCHSGKMRLKHLILCSFSVRSIFACRRASITAKPPTCHGVGGTPKTEAHRSSGLYIRDIFSAPKSRSSLEKRASGFSSIRRDR